MAGKRNFDAWKCVEGAPDFSVHKRQTRARLAILWQFPVEIRHFSAETFSACPLVRGNPSKMNPYLHSGFSNFCSMSLQTTSSLTSFPASIVAFNSFPNSEPEATSARSKSPGNGWFWKGNWHFKVFFRLGNRIEITENESFTVFKQENGHFDWDIRFLADILSNFIKFNNKNLRVIYF